MNYKKNVEKFDQGDINFLMSTDIKTNLSIESIVDSLENGQDPSVKFKGIKKVVKSRPTEIKLPLKYGGYKTTYSSVEYIDGQHIAKIDVWSDELGPVDAKKLETLTEEEMVVYNSSITVKRGYAILSNGRLKYPENYPVIELRGLEVKGFYDEDENIFTVDQEKGTDYLKDEWLAPVTYVEEVYQIKPSTVPQFAFKGNDTEIFPVYCFLPEAPKVKTSSGLVWEYAVVDKMIAISTKEGGEIAGASSISFQQFEDTYTDWDLYHNMQEEKKIRRA